MPDEKPRNKRGATRTRMLSSAVDVLRERGAAGVTIDEVLTRSGAPRGSVYHHFPDGRTQILTEALQFAGDSIGNLIEAGTGAGALTLVRTFAAFWERTLSESDFGAGCPVVAAAISPSDETNLIDAAGDIFRRWSDALARGFSGDGFDADTAASLAVTCTAALEGAVILCRSTRSTGPLRDVTNQLEFLIRSTEFVSKANIRH